MKSNLTSIIIVTYNSSAVIESCVNSFYQESEDVEIIIVDNASTDDTLTLIHSLGYGLKIIENRENLGFAKAVNIGARAANGDVFMLLNPDTVASTEQIRALAEKARNEPNTVFAPSISHPNNRLSIVSAGRFPTNYRMFLHYSGISRFSSNKSLEGHYLFPHQFSGNREVDWATGACLAIHQNTWECLNGLTERWFMYAEDIEFCWRLAKNGFRLELVQEIKILHEVGTGTSEPASMRADWVTNLWRFYRDDLSPNRSSAYLWKLIVSAGLMSRSFAYLFRSLRDPGRAEWRHESKRFRSFARALILVK